MSTEHQKYSTENQAEAIAQYAARRGFEIVRTYEDSGKSGLRLEGRISLQQLIADVRAGRTDYSAILVYDISRWGRFQDADESAYYEFVCREAGISVHYCAEQFENDGSISATIIKSVKRAMAGEYSRELSVKVFAGQCRLIRLGYRQGGPAGFGLRRQLVDEHGSSKGELSRGEQKSLQTDRVILTPGPPEEVEVVRRLYRMFVVQRRTEGEIAALLNAEGSTTDLGRPWTRGTVHQVLTNEKYLGNNVYNRVSNKLKAKRVVNPPDMWVRADAVFTGIVEPDFYEAAQRIIEDRTRRFTDQELLDRLSALLVEKGWLSGLVIDEVDDMPSSSTFRHRFGSLVRAYQLVGYASFLGLRVGLWHGDVGPGPRQRMLSDPPEILLTTPESLEAILISGRIDHSRFLSGVRAVVVDELHAFGGDDRGWHLRFVLARLERLAASSIQRVGLSATVGNPQALLDWLAQDRGGRVVGVGHPATDGDVTVDYVGSLANAIVVLSRLFRGERRLVFADSRSRVELIASGLRDAGLRTFVSHASLSADERRQAEAAFAHEPDCVIVATSTLELGLDVGDLDRVIQIGAPGSVASFLQRMGRTGRRARTTRNCLFLATDDDELLGALALTLLWREGTVEAITPPDFPAHLFAQQVMALCLQEGGIARGDIDVWLGDSISCIPRDTQDEVIRHMLSLGVLAEDAGVIGLGVVGEKEFGRRHFSDLVAAFSSPLLLTVRHGQSELGTVHPTSLARRSGDDAPTLLLGGRSWKVTDVDWPRRRVSVVPVEGGGRSRWLGTGRMLSLPIAHAEERIVTGADPGCRLSSRAADRLNEIRGELDFIDNQSLTIQSDEELTTVWLFGGGLVSASIARALSDGGLFVTRWNDISVSAKGQDFEAVTRVLRQLDAVAAYPALPEDLSTALKFGLCLPPAVAQAVQIARTSRPADVAAAISKPLHRVSGSRRPQLR